MTGVGSSQDSMSLDDLDSIMNLQRQEAFDDGGQQSTHKRSQPSSARRRVPKTSSFNKEKKLGTIDRNISKSMSLSSGLSLPAAAASEDSDRSSSVKGSRKKSSSSSTKKKSGSKTKPDKASSAPLPKGDGKRKASKSPKRKKSIPKEDSIRKSRSSSGERKTLGKSRSSSGDSLDRRKTLSSSSYEMGMRSEAHISMDRSDRKKRDSLRRSEHSSTNKQERKKRDSSKTKEDEKPSRRKSNESRTSTSKEDEKPPRRKSNESRTSTSKVEETPKNKPEDKLDAQSKEPKVDGSEIPSVAMKEETEETQSLDLGELDDGFENLWAEDVEEDEGDTGSNTAKKKRNKKKSNPVLQEELEDFLGKDDAKKNDNDSRDYRSSDSNSDKKRNSRTEKIHELQGKYEKYKRECISLSKENRKLKRDMRFNKGQVTSLTKEIDDQMAEMSTLRNNLSEALQQVNQLSDEQRLERGEYLSTTKELAQAKIDYTKTLNDGRELRAQVDRFEETLSRKERHASQLTQTLTSRTEELDKLQIKFCRAEDDIARLEADVGRLENELVVLKSAADLSGGDRSSTEVRSDIDQKLYEEREQNLEEKQKKLDAARREFEEEKRLHMQNEEKRRRQEEELKLQELEMERGHVEGRQLIDDEINQRLLELEDDNAALQGRLKADRLESSLQLKKKEDEMKKLSNQISQLKDEMAKKDADPDGITALKKEIEMKENEVALTQEDLAEAQKENGILEEQIEDLQTGNDDLYEELKRLETESADYKKQLEDWKKKAVEYKANASSWTAKTFEWKDKAEHWEKTARELDPEKAKQSPPPGAEPAPQAMFLQAAMEKKKIFDGSSANLPGVFGRIGGMFGKSSEDEDGAEVRVVELEEVNTQQQEIIKKLKSEMMKMRLEYRDEAYAIKKQLHALEGEKEALILQNTTLTKELELARKLESFAAHGDAI